MTDRNSIPLDPCSPDDPGDSHQERLITESFARWEGRRVQIKGFDGSGMVKIQWIESFDGRDLVIGKTDVFPSELEFDQS